MVFGLLERAVKMVLRFVLPLLLLVGVLVYLGQGITDTSVQEFSLDRLTEVGADSFTFSGTLALHNPSSIPAPLGSVEYDVFLNDTDQRLSSGSIEPFTLEPGVSRAQLRQEVEWVPTASLAGRLVTQEEVWVRVEGSAVIDMPFVREHPVPFEGYVDVRRYMLQFAPGGEAADQVAGGSDVLGDTAGALS